MVLGSEVRLPSPAHHRPTTHHHSSDAPLTNPSLLARSVQFRACAAVPITTERPVIAGLLLRFIILFVLDIFIYARFAWTPSGLEGMREEWSEHSTRLRNPATVEVETKGFRAELAELRRENAELRLKVYP